MTRGNSTQAVYVIKIVLRESKPAIWRRFRVPGAISLDRLHDVIQIVMGWQEKHLHCFEIGDQRYTEAPEDCDTEGIEEAHFTLDDLVSSAKTKFAYQYDFGDSWWHTLKVERVTPVPRGHCAYVACMDGKRSCPPEDVGGIDGYSEFLNAMKDRTHPEHESYQEWHGSAFDPKAFDADAVNLELAKYVRWTRPRAIAQELQGIDFVGS
ncbi:MAG: plasmid pRiA4b ORF-3 family protein [Phycisphaerae bacterium]|nr:plasmid pRiA4b ORF-3 family protein [Phycisphaerae bacterium]